MSQYLDLLASENYIQVNRKLVKLVGLMAATYWAELISIATHVKKRATANDSGFWSLDRKYMEDRTGITLTDQFTCDSLLSSLGILAVDPADSNSLGINLSDYINIILDDDIKQIDKVKKTVKVSREQKAKNKQEAIIATLKRCINEPNPTLRPLYESWVESVYSSGKGFLNKAKIAIFENSINGYTTDLQTKSLILNAAIQTGYTDPNWVITRYESDHKKVAANPPASTQRISTGVRTDIEF